MQPQTGTVASSYCAVSAKSLAKLIGAVRFGVEHCVKPRHCAEILVELVLRGDLGSSRAELEPLQRRFGGTGREADVLLGLAVLEISLDPLKLWRSAGREVCRWCEGPGLLLYVEARRDYLRTYD